MIVNEGSWEEAWLAVIEKEILIARIEHGVDSKAYKEVFGHKESCEFHHPTECVLLSAARKALRRGVVLDECG